MKQKIRVFLNKPLPEIGMHLLQQEDIELIQPHKVDLTQLEWLTYCQKSDVILSVGKSSFDAAFFEQCPNVKAIALFSVGYDHVDIVAATKHKVAISNTPDVLSQATADTAFLLMQMTARKASFNLEKVKNGQWTANFVPLANLGQELKGRTLGILGLGRIGYEMAKKCKYAFDMPIIYHNRNKNEALEKEIGATFVSFEELLHQSDVFSIHANFSSTQTHLFNKDTFEQMKPNAIFINTARGGFVKEIDLYHALKNKVIFGAGLDVTEIEPLSTSSPLLTLENINIFPHIGSATVEARNGMAKLAVENVLAFVQNKQLPTIVNPAIYNK